MGGQTAPRPGSTLWGGGYGVGNPAGPQGPSKPAVSVLQSKRRYLPPFGKDGDTGSGLLFPSVSPRLPRQNYSHPSPDPQPRLPSPATEPTPLPCPGNLHLGGGGIRPWWGAVFLFGVERKIPWCGGLRKSFLEPSSTFPAPKHLLAPRP